jgi:choline transport protein
MAEEHNLAAMKGAKAIPSAQFPSFEDDQEDYHDSVRGYTRADHVDMQRMGKATELKRNYRPLSALAFTVILQGTWEVLMT